MKRFSLAVGPLLMRGTPSGLLVLKLIGDQHARDRHLTIPLVPDKNGIFGPHLTTEGRRGRKNKHEPLVEMPFEEFLEFISKVEKEIALSWWSRMRLVDLEELAASGYEALPLHHPRMERLITRYLRARGKHVSFAGDLHAFEEDFVSVWRDLACPPSLLALDPQRRPALVLRLDEELGEGLWLAYFERPRIFGAPPGWYAAPIDLETAEGFMSVLLRHAGSGLLDLFDRIERHLGADG
jgi:hypothetical protein